MSNKSIISIDYGNRKSGLAYSIEGFAFAHETVLTSGLIPYLEKWIEERRADIIIIGLPLNIDGSESRQSGKVRRFAKVLSGHFPTREIILHDERLTTAEARMSDASDIDAESARLILEEYLASIF